MSETETARRGSPSPEPERLARCSCGKFSMRLRGEPSRVYGCACIECQRSTGSVFGYRAIYPEEAVQKIEGDAGHWRRAGDAGRWVEQHFCPACGTVLYMTAEALTGAISVSVGCFEDRDLPRPSVIHNQSSAAPWLQLSDFSPRALSRSIG